VFVMACFGTGEPTDNAKPFYDWLQAADRQAEKSKDAFKDVKYAVCSTNCILLLHTLILFLNCRCLGWGKARHILNAIKM